MTYDEAERWFKENVLGGTADYENLPGRPARWTATGYRHDGTAPYSAIYVEHGETFMQAVENLKRKMEFEAELKAALEDPGEGE